MILPYSSNKLSQGNLETLCLVLNFQYSVWENGNELSLWGGKSEPQLLV